MSSDVARAVVILVDRQSTVTSPVEHQQRHSASDQHVATNVEFAVVEQQRVHDVPVACRSAAHQQSLLQRQFEI